MTRGLSRRTAACLAPAGPDLRGCSRVASGGIVSRESPFVLYPLAARRAVDRCEILLLSRFVVNAVIEFADLVGDVLRLALANIVAEQPTRTFVTKITNSRRIYNLRSLLD
jgi:hypothetical protein